jgi:hypothetical protein
VVLCIRKCIECGLEAALGDLPRSGKARQLPDDAIAVPFRIFSFLSVKAYPGSQMIVL